MTILIHAWHHLAWLDHSWLDRLWLLVHFLLQLTLDLWREDGKLLLVDLLHEQFNLSLECNTVLSVEAGTLTAYLYHLLEKTTRDFLQVSVD